jgi:hypothetical protein
MSFELIKNKDNVDIQKMVYSGDKLTPEMAKIPEFLPKKNFSFYIVGLPGSGKSTILNTLLCASGRKKKNSDDKGPCFYYKQFDRVHIFSPSISTQTKPFKLSPERIHPDFDPELLASIIKECCDGANINCMFVFDDVIRAINNNGGENAKVLHKMLLNRRHITHNPDDDDEEAISGCSSIITSQRYNLLPMYIRSSGISHLILLKVTNQKDLKDIHQEVAPELTFDMFKEICKFCWEEPHEFLYIIMGEHPSAKYHKNFDRIKIEEVDLA